jgi:hypothetical protein
MCLFLLDHSIYPAIFGAVTLSVNNSNISLKDFANELKSVLKKKYGSNSLEFSKEGNYSSNFTEKIVSKDGLRVDITNYSCRIYYYNPNLMAELSNMAEEYNQMIFKKQKALSKSDSVNDL